MSVQAWVDDRLPADSVHVDVAAAGRISAAVLSAQVDHLERETREGAYVAEERARPALDAGRAALGALVGLQGNDVFFTDGGATSFAVLLEAWPLARGSRVGVAPSDYASNALLLTRRAAERGWELVELPADDLGHVTAVPPGLDLIALPMVPSQRGIVQPVDDLLSEGVPLILDIAQAGGQVDVPAGAAAYVGTARKWLCGPRGVGFAAIAPEWQQRLAPPPTLSALDQQGIQRYDTYDPHVSGRLGLSVAARSWSPALLAPIAAAASAARVLLEGAGGWRVVEPVDEASGITTLVHDNADPIVTRARLIDQGLLVSAVPTTRSVDQVVPALRVSTAAWVTPDDLERLASALDRLSR